MKSLLTTALALGLVLSGTAVQAGDLPTDIVVAGQKSVGKPAAGTKQKAPTAAEKKAVETDGGEFVEYFVVPVPEGAAPIYPPQAAAPPLYSTPTTYVTNGSGRPFETPFSPGYYGYGYPVPIGFGGGGFGSTVIFNGVLPPTYTFTNALGFPLTISTNPFALAQIVALPNGFNSVNVNTPLQGIVPFTGGTTIPIPTK